MAARYRWIVAILALLCLASPSNGQPATRTSGHDLTAIPGSLHPLISISDPTVGNLADQALLESAWPAHQAAANPAAALLMQQLSRIWDPLAAGGLGDWLDESRVTFTRNASGREIGLLIEDWHVASESWIPSYRQSTTLDSNGRAVERIDEQWDPDANGGQGGWAPALRVTFTWNDQNRIIVSMTEFWDEDSGDYIIYSRLTTTYDASGERVEQQVFESGLFGPLSPSLRYSFEYDEDGNTIRRLYESYNTLAGEFVNNEDLYYSYDSNGELIEELEFDWDAAANGGAGGWVNYYRTTTVYFPNSGTPTQIVETEQSWDGGGAAWVNVERNVLEGSPSLVEPTEIVDTDQDWDPSANGGLGDWLNVDRSITSVEDLRPVSFVAQEWNAAQGAWVNEDRETVEYDASGNAVSSLGEIWNGAAWENATLLLMTYEEFSTAIADEHISRGHRLESNYPNPFTESTTISFTVDAPEHVTLEVYDLLGRRVRTIIDADLPPGKHNATVAGGTLPAGLYVYRLNGRHFSESRSMLLVR
jgi:hypothetical protein